MAVAAACATDDTIEFEPIGPPVAAHGAWWAARECSGVLPVKGGELGDVQWFVADLAAVRPHLMGAWLPPDTIVPCPIDIPQRFAASSREGGPCGGPPPLAAALQSSVDGLS